MAYPQTFHHSLCGCFDDFSQLADTFCCFACQVGRQFAALEGRPNTHDCAMCMVAFCFPGLVPCFLRCKVSDKYQLGEGCCASTCIGFWCGPCSVCQTGRELNYRGVNPGGCCCKPQDAYLTGAGMQPPLPPPQPVVMYAGAPQPQPQPVVYAAAPPPQPVVYATSPAQPPQAYTYNNNQPYQ